MLGSFYIERTVEVDGKAVAEQELLAGVGVMIVLGEPGSGKTELLRSFGYRLGVASERASIFQARSTIARADSLILDAFDEVAKLDYSAVDVIVARARETEAKRVILASRSSEWEEARSVRVEECFGSKPRIVKLLALDDGQQRAIFLNHVPEEDFELFKAEVARFELSPLLGNPQFLKLFADSYVESNRHFKSKNEIFANAARRLAQEANRSVVIKGRPAIEKILSLAGEVFSKLLFSGADGVSLDGASEERQYPKLDALFREPDDELFCIIDTRLFKLASSENKHEPVHRIVAEYLSAVYVAGRISDPADLLSLQRCLSIVAPNNVVRDELRGLVGWLAAVGSKEIQEAVIEMDPYAVLANGDPSMLLDSSKSKLLNQLREVAAKDPDFRRGDCWRTFSSSGFFTPSILQEFKDEIVSETRSEYRDLLLELLGSSGAARFLSSELRRLLLSESASIGTRLLAHKNLLTVVGHEHNRDCNELINEGSKTSLSIAAKTLAAKGVNSMGRGLLLSFLECCAGLYFPRRSEENLTIGGRYFITSFITELNLQDVIWLLDQLTPEIRCRCNAKHEYDCHCKNGPSKIAGRLLDRYFELREDQDDAESLWRWIKPLRFVDRVSSEDFVSVKCLRQNAELRQNIHKLAFEGICDSAAAQRIRYEKLSDPCHAGVRLNQEDIMKLIVDAYEAENIGLWISFFEYQNPWSRRHKRNEIRFRMRHQTNENPLFIGAWAVQIRDNRYSNKYRAGRSFRSSRRSRRMKRRRAEIKENNAKHLKENLRLIEAGKHYGWLDFFAHRYIHEPDQLLETAVFNS